jgi:hypothetical protein
MILLQLGLKDEKLWFVKTKVQCETKQLPQKQKKQRSKACQSMTVNQAHFMCP